MDVNYEQATQVLRLLELKLDAVTKIRAAVRQQMACFDEIVLDEDYFEQQQNIVDEYIEKLNQWNEQFDIVYPQAVKQMKELIKDKAQLAEAIRQKHFDLIAALEKMKHEEAGLREMFEEYMAEEYKKIREKNVLSKKTEVYYQSMTRQMDAMSYFYDQKN